MGDLNRYIMESVLAGKIDKEVAVRLLTTLKNSEHKAGEGIAVIGMALKFPTADSPDAYWEVIANRADSVRSLPQRRKRDVDAYLQYMGMPADERRYIQAGFLDQVDSFDYRFFRLTPKEASLMDPGQRLFLQTVWEAIEDAGYGGEQLAGSRTGVYVGYATYPAENYYRALFDIDPVLLETGTVGNIPALLPSRISYLLNLRGPAILLDTACSSSLMAIHLACQAIKKGECDMAVAGGVRVSLIPAVRNSLKLGVESADSITRAFDEHSTGAGPGEGVAAVLLKPLQRAINDGDHLYAVIRGGASNQDGSSISITAPNPAAQADVLLQAWRDAGISPEALSYIECHGSGTRLGDPIEIEGLERAFSQHTDRKQFCGIGTVKTNIGHLNESAGIAGFIKAVLALKHRQLPPSAHFHRPNAAIAFSDSPVYVNTRLRPWETTGQPRLCGVSSFGLSGTNCHLVLEEAPEVEPIPAEADPGLHLLTLSAKTPSALMALVRSYAEEVADLSSLRLEDVCYTTNTGRGHYGYRLALTVTDPADFRAKLRELCQTDLATANGPWLSYGYHRVITDDREHREAGDIPSALKAELDRQVAALVAAFVASGRKDENLLHQICRLYAGGAQIPWAEFYTGGTHRRVSLPTYPFEDIHCWVELPAEAAVEPGVEEPEPLDGLHYRMAWRQGEAVRSSSLEAGSRVLLLTSAAGRGHPLPGQIAEALQREGFDPVEALAPGADRLAQGPEVTADVEREYRALFERLGNTQSLRIIHLVALPSGNGIPDADSLQESQVRGVFSLYHMVRGFLQQNVVKSAEIMLVAERVQEVTGQESGLNPQFATLLGLGKVVGQEYPNLRVRCLDIDEATTAAQIVAELAADGHSSPVAYRSGQRFVPELREVELNTTPEQEVPIRAGGLYLITGGFGGIGLTMAGHLAAKARVRLALIGRSGLPERAEWERIVAEDTDPKLCARLRSLMEIEANGSEVLCFRADIAREEELRPIIDTLRARYGRIDGVLHCAGVAGASILIRKELSQFLQVSSPKVQGTWLLDRLTEPDSPDFFALFSSAATLAGEASMGDYVAANSFQDAYSAYRNRRGGRTLTLDWVAWRDAGMSVEFGVNVDTIFKALPTEVALRAFDQALGTAADRYVIGEINPAWYGQWITLAEMLPYRLSDRIARVLNQAKARLASRSDASEVAIIDEHGHMAFVPLKTAGRLRKANSGAVTLTGKAGAEFSEIERRLAAVYSEVLGYSEINIYDSFFELGGDSILLARVYALVEKEFPGLVRMTDLFEHTSVSKLAAYIQGSRTTEPAAPIRPVKTRDAGPNSGDIAIIGLAFEMPGANSLESLRDVVFGAGDSIRNFPASRREEMDRYIDFLRKAKLGGAGVLEGMAYAPGGYLEDVAGFDHKLFRVSPKEASLMDPSQRAFLEVAWRAIEDAGYGGKIEGSRTGVWVGYAENSTYMQMVMNAEPNFLADSIVGNIGNMMSGRISYLLDLRGPGMVIDAACASSLVAVHLASHALRTGECDMAIAGGIKLHLLPQDHPTLKVGYEASDGMTRSFDEGASGSGHGEGVAALVLKPLEQAERDGDQIYAVVRGSAVNQDGRSMSLTAPNPLAQVDVITEAWANAGLDPEALSYLEAHGTATRLGDPIEVDALERAFGMYTDRKQFCAIGSIKANMGHLYECAGMAGLLKSILILQDRVIPPSVHFDRPNAKIDFTGGALYVNTVPRPIKTDGRPALCAVSAFGLNGTNSHIILEEYRPAVTSTEEEPGGIQILPMSARSQEALLHLVQEYREFLGQKAGQARLADIVGTAATGRGHYEHRLALAVRDLDQLRAMLEQIGETGLPTEHPGVFYAQHKVVPEGKENRPASEITAAEKAALSAQAAAAIGQRLANRDDEVATAEVCRLYVQGADLDWEAALDGVSFRRISLPAYPFERQKCWLEVPELEELAEPATGESVYFAMKWREVPLAVRPDAGRMPEGTALLLRPAGGMEALAAGLAQELRQHGLRVVEALTGCERFEQPSELLFHLGDDETHYQRLLHAADHPLPLTVIFYLADSAGAQFPTLDDLRANQGRGAYSLFCLTRALGAIRREIEVVVGARSVQRVTGREAMISPDAASVFGLNKVMRKEYPNLTCRRIDLDTDTPAVDLIREWQYGGASSDVAYRQGARYEMEFGVADIRSANDIPWAVREEGVYLISGGAGGIGLEIARHLATLGRVKLALIGRSRLPDRVEWERIAAQPDHRLHRKIVTLREIKALGAEVVLYAADVADAARMAEIASELRSQYGRINGVIHAAGVARDRLIADREPNGFDWDVFSPKVYGSWVLDQVTRQDELDFFILFSSVATFFPTTGQGEYVAANGFLDAFAAWRNLQGKRTMTINWTTWKETGMAFESGFTVDTIFKALPSAAGVGWFAPTLSKEIANLLIGQLNYDGGGIFLLERSQVKLAPEIQQGVADHKLRSGHATRSHRQRGSTAKEVKLGGKSDEAYTAAERTLAQICREVLGLEYIDVYDNFFELGAESVMLMRIQQRLDGVYPGQFTITDLFEYPSIYKLAGYISSQVGDEPAQPARPAPSEEDAPEGVADTDIAIVGMAARLPASDSLEEFWTQIRNGAELTGKLPASRLEDINRYLSVSKPFPEGSYQLAEGAYLEEIDKFDYGFFRLSPREAALMDPNQRLALMTAWEAVEDAGYGGGRIAGTSTGVFFGFGAHVKDTYSRYIMEFEPLSLLDADLGNTAAVLPGRISYLLDLKGPSMVVDTACSSSLTAVHLAVQAIRRGDCELALAGGIKLITLPVTFLEKPAGIGSADARTRTFDHLSDGTALGEGAAAILLKPLRAALRDGDQIHAVIKGSAVNQDGSSAGLSAPNPAAQQQVLLRAWADAGVDPESIAYIEAHGTGTPLGDPIEVRALENAFSQRTGKRGFCALSSVKSNIGHLSEGAGMASLVKAVLALKHKELPPSINFQRPNEQVDFINSALYVNTRLQRWERGPHPRRCGVSGFGISGTNAHVVLEEAPERLPERSPSSSDLHLLALSARTPSALRALVQAYAEQAVTPSDLPVADLCYTANTGRGHYAHRLALILSDPADLRVKLQELSSADLATFTAPWFAYGYHRMVPSDREHREAGDLTGAARVELERKAGLLMEELLASGQRDPERMHRLCRLYVSGADVRWDALYEGEARRKVSLPTYPFEGTRCWIDLPTEPEVLPAEQPATPEGLFYSVGWHRSEAIQARMEGAGGRALLLTAGGGKDHPLAEQMADALRRKGFDLVVVPAPDAILAARGTKASGEVEEAYCQLFERLGETQRLHLLHMATLLGDSGIADAPSLDRSQAMGMLSLYHLVRGFSKQRAVKSAEILLVSERVHEVTGQESDLNPQYASFFGLGKCVGQEYPGLRVRAVDIDERTTPEQLLAELAAADDRMNPVAYRDGQRFVQQLGEANLAAAPEGPVTLREGGLYLITGGTGGIGLALAKHLAEKQRVRLALVSRSGLPERSEWDSILAEGADPRLCARLKALREIEALGSEIIPFRADVAAEAELRPVIEELRQRYGRIDGVLHCAGLAGASILIRKDLSQFLEVTTPKVQGTWLLDHLTQADSPDFFAMCSSIATLTGEASMGDYVAANTFQDAYTAYRGRTGGRTLTINWVAWRDAGMSVEFGVNVDGIFKAIPTDVAVTAFDQALSSSLPRVIVGELNREMAVQFANVSDLLPCRISPLLSAYAAEVKRSLAAQAAQSTDVALIENGQMTVLPAKTLAKLRKASAGAVALKGRAGAVFSEIERKLAAVYSEVLGYQEINVHDSFFELGGDSILLARVYALVDKEFPGALRMTDLFEYTSVSKLAAFIQGSTASEPAVPIRPVKPRDGGPNSGDVAIIGLAFEMPGVDSLEGLRDIVFGGGDCIRSFPASRRKEMDRYRKFLEQTGRDGAMILDGEFEYAAGGYLDDVAGFDHKLFRISPKEASLMDPSQRAFLEITWRAIEDAGYGGKIEGTRTGVWVGYAANNTYQRMVFDAEPAFLTNSIVGNMSNMMAGRIAYLHDLKGPTMVVDTACSSSLVAVHMACQALRAGECEMALAGGVKLHLLPQDHPILRIGNETSDGMTRSFDEGASGAGHGEGVAALLLKPLEQAERDGDQIYAVIKGSALNHGGRAMSLTAPNPSAQVEVITEAWASAGLDPETLCYLEAHGTATRLGDPLEFDALQRAFAMFTTRKQFCAIGSIKANMGHLFECAGMAGLLKSILILQDRLLPPAVHFDRPNAKIDFSDSALYVNTVPRPIETNGRPAVCAVSAFGISGTNSHLVLEEYRAAGALAADEPGFSQILPLSARSEEALLRLVRSYRDLLQNAGKVRLTDIVGTAATGRGHYEHRLAFLVRSLDELKALIARVCETGLPAGEPTLFYAQHKVVPDGKATRARGEITAQEKAALRDQAEVVIDRLRGNPGDAEAAAELCRLYVQGADIDWEQALAEVAFRRIGLPPYPFERHACWVEIPEVEAVEAGVEIAMDDQGYFNLTWREVSLPDEAPASELTGGTALLFRPAGQGDELAEELAQELRQQGLRVVEALTGCERFQQAADLVYHLSDDEAACAQVLAAADHAQPLTAIFYLVDSGGDHLSSLTALQETQRKGTYALFCLARALGAMEREIEVIVAARDVQQVTGRDERINPEAAAVFGFSRVIPKEHPNLLCRRIDLDGSATAADLVREWSRGAGSADVAYRNGHRYVVEFGEVDLRTVSDNPCEIREEGVYLISGGAGGIGLEIGKYLATIGRVKLALINRSELPDRAEWEQILSQPDHRLSRKIATLREIESLGAEVLLYSANVADADHMAEIAAELRSRYGRINGVIHAAGVARDQAIADRQPNGFDWNVFTPKVYGTWVLDQVTRQDELDFFVLFSSVATFFPTYGQGEYVAGNAFLDAFAAWRNLQGRRTMTVNWTTWKETGMAFESGFTVDTIFKVLPTAPGVSRFARVLSKSLANVLIGDLNYEGNGLLLLQRSSVRIAQSLQAKVDAYLTRSGKQVRLPQPTRKGGTGEVQITGRADGNYSALERMIATIWSEVLGFGEISLYDSYFELGGDSISGLKIAHSIGRELGRSISMAELLMHTTVSDLAEYIATAYGERSGGEAEATALPPLLPVAEREYYPVSPSQRGLYLLNEMEAVGTSYNVPSVHLIEGELDLERLQMALSRLAARHEALRTSFHLIDGEPVQVVHKTVDLPLEYLEIGECSDEAEAMARARSAFAAFLRPFDLSRAPLFRFGVARLSPSRFMLLSDIHHIISDGITQEILGADFMKYYRGEELPPLPVQYKDYSVWMKALSEGDFMRGQEEYWLRTFSGETPVIQLPTDYPRPLHQTFEGGHVQFTLTPRQTEALRRLARETESTLYATLLSVFKVLLWKYSGQEDLVVGSPVVGRLLPDLEQVAGMFVNTLLMRSYPAGSKSFRQFLDEVRSSTISALAHQYYPYATLVEKVGVRRDLSRNPLFDVMFILQNYGLGESGFSEGFGVPVDTEESLINAAAKFDISIAAVDLTDGILFDIEYRTKLFREETMVRLGKHFGRIVDAVTDDPEVALHEIDLLTADERDDILQRFNSTGSEWEVAPLHVLFERQAARSPQRPALVWQETVVTYGELNSRANALAALLRGRGVGRESLVAVMMERSPSMILAILAVLKAGGAYLPVDSGYPVERIQYMLADSGACLLLSQTSLAGALQAAVPEVLWIDTLHLDGSHAENLPNVNDPGDLAFVLYTSGTTGKPKGVMLEHRNIAAYVHAFTSEVGPLWDEVVLQVSSFSFDNFVEEVYPTLLGGGKLVIPTGMEFLDMADFAGLVNLHQVTLISTSPLLLAEINGVEGLQSIRTVISGGDVLKPEYVSNLVKQARVYNTYGPTEATVCAAYHRYTRSEQTRSIPLGRPIANWRVYLLDQGGKLVPVGVPGELYIAGAGVSRGYLGREELTAERFMPDPWVPGERMYRTGDLARWLPDGSIEFLGRTDTQVKIRGFRVELGEIEAVLMQHPGIHEVVVGAREDRPGDKRLVAYAVAAGEADLDGGTLRQYLRAIMPEYMVPSAFVILPALPMTPNGKVDVRALPLPEGGQEGMREPYVAPRTSVEEALATIWADLLQLERVGVNDHFFDLGGHSLLATRMVSRVRAALGVDLALRSLFDAPTVAELAIKVEEAMLAEVSGQELALLLAELEGEEEG